MPRQQIGFEAAVGAGAYAPLGGIPAALIFKRERQVILAIVRPAALGAADSPVVAKELLVEGAPVRSQRAQDAVFLLQNEAALPAWRALLVHGTELARAGLAYRTLQFHASTS